MICNLVSLGVFVIHFAILGTTLGLPWSPLGCRWVPLGSLALPRSSHWGHFGSLLLPCDAAEDLLGTSGLPRGAMATLG